jgi:hypothetical protein
VAGSEDVVACGRALAEAAGPALPVQMATWALLALAAEPALRLHGPRLRLYAVPWLLVAFAGTALAPAALGAPAPPVLPAGVAVVLAAILVAVRSAVTAEPRARAAAPGSV